jgi:hypothetical protein
LRVADDAGFRAVLHAACCGEMRHQQSRFRFSDQAAFDRDQSAIDSWDPAIRQIALVMGNPVPPNCVAGVFPLTEINAVAKALPNQSGYIIGVNEGLFYFVEGMAQICALYFPFSDDPMADFRKNPLGCALFAELLSSLAGFSDIAPFQNCAKTDEQTQLIETMSHLMTFYVSSHEYAHVMLGHHAALGHSQRKIASGHIQFDEIPLSQRLEFDADFTGLLTTLAFADRTANRLALTLWAADFYFAAVSFWEGFVEEVVTPVAHHLRDVALRQGLDVRLSASRPVSETHPPTSIRRSMLRGRMISTTEGPPFKNLTVEEALNKKPPKNTELDIAFTMGDRSSPFLAALWECSRASFSDSVRNALRGKG